MKDSKTGQLLVASSLVTDPVQAAAVCLVVHEDDDNVIAVMLNRPMKPSPEAMMALLNGAAETSDDEQLPTDEQSQVELETSGEGSFEANSPSSGQSTSQPPPLDRLTIHGISDSKDHHRQSHGALHFGGPLSGPVVAIHQTSRYAEAETGNGIYVAAQKQILENLLRDDEAPYRLIVGHLGWASRQLDAEIEAGMWHVVPATVECVFSAAGEMWPRVIRRATSRSMARWMGIADLVGAAELN